jgi:hypothetical protein
MYETAQPNAPAGHDRGPLQAKNLCLMPTASALQNRPLDEREVPLFAQNPPLFAQNPPLFAQNPPLVAQKVAFFLFFLEVSKLLFIFATDKACSVS